MDLQELRERSGIDLRKLRYCLDHDLIPGLYIELTPREAGRPRKFAPDVGFGIVCAAELLNLGLPHETIRGFLAGLLSIKLVGRGQPKPALLAVLERSAAATAYLGDSRFCRMVVDDYDFDSGWVAVSDTKRPNRNYKPKVTVVLDIGQIRDLVFTDR